LNTLGNELLETVSRDEKGTGVLELGCNYEPSLASLTLLLGEYAVNYSSAKLVSSSVDQIEVSFERWLLEPLVEVWK
jgi:hypothetical protein